MQADQSANLTWQDETIPVSTRFNDPYFSLKGGLGESAHVFLAGNDLASRFAGADGSHEGFHIGELGFGTGLNMLAAWRLWRQSGARGTLRFTSFEAFPMRAADTAQALAAFPEIADLAAPFMGALARWHEAGQARADTPVFEAEGLCLRLVLGDARATLPAWDGAAEAWFLDGFSPAKNPEMWGKDLMAAVGAKTARGGTFATYSAAGAVRRALDAAGFEVMRVPGYMGKRHMSRGVLRAPAHAPACAPAPEPTP